METVNKIIVVVFFTAAVIVSGEVGYLWGSRQAAEKAKANAPIDRSADASRLTAFLDAFTQDANRNMYVGAEYAGFVDAVDVNATAEGALRDMFRIAIVDNDGNAVITATLPKERSDKHDITTFVYQQEVPGAFTELKKGDKVLLLLKYDILSPAKSYETPAYSKLFYISPAK